MCIYCEGAVLIEKGFPDVSFGSHTGDDIYQIFIDRGHLRLCMIDDSNCLDHGEKIKINFCPFCGGELNK